MSKISVNQLVKHYQDTTVLDEISFEVPAGSVTALLGASGGGKSTLLRCLARLEVPDSGEVLLYGKRVGLVFQQFHLWQHLTILENLIMAPMHVLKVSKKLAITEAENLLQKLNILDKTHQLPAKLSGGEQQRAAIARTLMMRPSLLLFDEPTSALDPERTQNIVHIIQELAISGMTLLIATHDLGFARRVANNALFLEKGKILEFCKLKNQQFNPESSRFKEFLQEKD